MAYSRVPKINSYSLTDFHDFDDCPFRFFVRHHLDRKYEIASGSPQMALGVLLDKSIKNIHKYKAYDHDIERLVKVVRFSAKEIVGEEESNPRKPNFNSAVVKFLTEEVLIAAEGLFRNYHNQIQGKFSKSIIPVDFCKYFFVMNGEDYLLWGGPDTIEMGEDGIPEVIDYKSRQDIAKGKERMDMDLMPKIYILLTADLLKRNGYKKARFKVKFWQDPMENSFSQEFSLEDLEEIEKIFSKRVKIIKEAKSIDLCGSKYCDACNIEKKDDFVGELGRMGFKVMSGEEFLEKNV